MTPLSAQPPESEEELLHKSYYTTQLSQPKTAK